MVKFRVHPLSCVGFPVYISHEHLRFSLYLCQFGRQSSHSTHLPEDFGRTELKPRPGTGMYLDLAFIIPRPKTLNLARCILIIIEFFSSVWNEYSKKRWA